MAKRRIFQKDLYYITSKVSAFCDILEVFLSKKVEKFLQKNLEVKKKVVPLQPV